MSGYTSVIWTDKFANAPFLFGFSFKTRRRKGERVTIVLGVKSCAIPVSGGVDGDGFMINKEGGGDGMG